MGLVCPGRAEEQGLLRACLFLCLVLETQELAEPRPLQLEVSVLHPCGTHPCLTAFLCPMACVLV